MFKYLLYQLFRRTKKSMVISGNENIGGARFAVLIALSIIPSVVLTSILENYGIVKINYENEDSSTLIIGVVSYLPVYLILSFLIKKEFLLSLSYTKKEKQKYNLIILAIILSFIAYVIYKIKTK